MPRTSPGDTAHPERYAALEEFVFNATHEDLSRLRRYMEEHGQRAVGSPEVAQLFDKSPEDLHVTTSAPKDMFFTFRERELWARNRRLNNLPGPKKTAEEHVMIYVLGRE